MKNFKVSKVISSLILLLVLGISTYAAKVKYISIATSSAGGAFSIIGTAMSDIINKNDSNVSANIEITGGSSENILLARNKNVELAMTASDVLALALEGKGSFEGKKIDKDDLRGVMGGHMTTLQVYTLRDGKIKSFKDLKGKKIAVGPAGSVAGDAMKTIMDAYGYEINKDWKPEYLSHGDGAEALTDGNVDAVCIMSTLPASPVTTAAASRPIRLLGLEKEYFDKIMTECPYYIPAKIAANVYNGQDEEIEYTFGSASILITYRDMPEEDIYNMAKALFENNELLVAAYPQCNEWNIENATRGLEGLVEMHPGVIKYLKEKGIMN
ncbi:TAXI family TRAP transporter solute-binding subunit [Fusobacterium ulcerans]|uniref:TAXI family TRAP transporter solute-binding subunit n=1 Tax=Fusobacterium ulcerans TaxID=861 RepID=UPI0026EB0BC2|nr:TAXI family TRAP transporter solute-binding subunit [Fusobacterium ulcerans]